jgi:hypothetical protein
MYLSLGWKKEGHHHREVQDGLMNASVHGYEAHFRSRTEYGIVQI